MGTVVLVAVVICMAVYLGIYLKWIERLLQQVVDELQEQKGRRHDDV